MKDNKKRATIKDIAKKTGVSVATVSYVINGINKVSDDTKRLILKTMEEMDYKPNLTARSLTNRHSNMIGILLPITEKGSDASLLLKDNPFYGELISGAEYKATELGYDILIKGIRPGESCRDWIIKRNLDGAVFIGNYTVVISEEMKKLGSELVLMDAYDEGTKIHHSIGIDDMRGGYLATKYLLELGHRKIAIAASNIMVDGAIYRRFLGYKNALSEYGISATSHLIFQDTLTFEGGYRTGVNIIKSREKISGVFAVADIVAFGIIKAFYDYGKEIPKDLSVVGFDDTKECEYNNPGLTTVHQPIYEKGATAVETIVDAIRQKSGDTKHIMLPIELRIRESAMEYKD
ncbi:MAG: hypothetical protein ACFWTJ_12265 [Lachnoclostridium sp.]|jgi:LacI family transcriptional regulator